jgi:S-adenosylmethionine synthetase
MARYVAKNLVAAGLADEALVQLAYAIGVAEPVSVNVNTYGTGTHASADLSQLVREVFPLTPVGIIRALDLTRPRFRQTAAYGHFGRTGDAFTWERLDKVDELKAAAASL